jgi:hypothetical protein
VIRTASDITVTLTDSAGKSVTIPAGAADVTLFDLQASVLTDSTRGYTPPKFPDPRELRALAELPSTGPLRRWVDRCWGPGWLGPPDEPFSILGSVPEMWTWFDVRPGGEYRHRPWLPAVGVAFLTAYSPITPSAHVHEHRGLCRCEFYWYEGSECEDRARHERTPARIRHLNAQRRMQRGRREAAEYRRLRQQRADQGIPDDDDIPF